MKISARNQLKGTVRSIRRTKSLEDPCVTSRPFAWSLGEALHSGNGRRPGPARRDESTQDTLSLPPRLPRLPHNLASARKGNVQRYRLQAKGEA